MMGVPMCGVMVNKGKIAPAIEELLEEYWGIGQYADRNGSSRTRITRVRYLEGSKREQARLRIFLEMPNMQQPVYANIPQHMVMQGQYQMQGIPMGVQMQAMGAPQDMGIPSSQQRYSTGPEGK